MALSKFTKIPMIIRLRNHTVVSYQNESFFIKMRAAFLAPILPRVMEEGESKEGSSHFDEKLTF